ncbi:hypothetical protein B4082_0807 [Bacillus cereus]|uniref:Uncharacterized protein n=1 Tax=Bacillus cereus TaxID=1396 RepID=A0A164HMK3_BACCE|nr:hypothetical protein B4082_0807 [Bacillus cereus]
MEQVITVSRILREIFKVEYAIEEEAGKRLVIHALNMND